MFAEKKTLTIVTASDGTVTAYSPNITGQLLAIRYVKAGSGNYTDGVDLTVTVEGTGEAVLTVTNMNASASYYPRVPTHDTAAAAALYAAGGAGVNEPIVLANDRLKFVLASGGDAKTGTFHLVVG